jgi:undecaprenyl-diphosphatase
LEEKVNLVKRSDGTLYRGGMYSFPSGHASNSVVLLLFFAFFAKCRRWSVVLMSVWVLLFAYSRIYLGVHYPFDIFVGFFMGSCWALIFIMLFYRIFSYN